MKGANYLFTIERDGVKKTIIDRHTNPLIFLSIEKEVGYNTILLFVMEITEDEYYFYLNNF
jgi:hypothetical protein